jgi:hypothetical protein
MTARELGAHRDAHLEMETLSRKSGPILESAVQMLISIHAPFFKQIGPDLRHLQTGETIEEWMKARRKSNPNDYADWTPDDPDQLLHTYIEEAMTTPSPKTLGRLYTFLKDPTRYNTLCAQWGCDPVRMIPGKRPGSDDEAKPKTSGENNPFNPTKVYGSDQARQNEIAKYIVAFGTASAVRSAAKFKVDLAGRKLTFDGASRPVTSRD